ncbi:MAG: cupin domain-containing protein [Candidatus Omnitrophica bacterium]|nr:cupin domain-containing protein [Candidatus Omnitrophota bacterium]
MRARGVERRSYARTGKLLPKTAKRLRGRSVRLPPHGVMDWHSTARREELLVALAGSVRVEYRNGRGRTQATTVRAGQCAFIPSGVRHRVINRTTRVSHYLYVTA